MTGAELRCYEGPAFDGREMGLMDGCSNPGAPGGIQRGSPLVEAVIVAISSEEIVRCKLGPVWGGAVATPPKNPVSPSHIGQREIRRNPPPAASSVFMTSAVQTRDASIHSECQSRTRRLSRPDEGAIGSDPRNPMHLPRGLQVSVIPGNRC